LASTGFRKALTEFAVITVSILMAFSLDAWWDHRSQRADLVAALTALQNEFTAAQTEFPRAHGLVDRVAEKAGALQDLMGPDPTLAAVDSLRVLGTEFRGTTSDLPMAILHGLLDSDLLGAASSMELRTGLAEWPAHVANYEEVEGYLNAHITLFSARADEVTPDPRSPFAFDGEAILSDPWFWNRLRRAIGATIFVRRDNEALSARAESLKGLIAAELGR
jgi:hypothetical protein